MSRSCPFLSLSRVVFGFALLAMSGLILIGTLGCSAPAPAAEFVAQAERLHREALASAVIGNADLREYVQLVGDRIGDAARRVVPGKASEQLLANLRCHLSDDSTINVFHTGGNHIYVYRGLFDICETEDELAAAIAHAYAHAIQLDVEKTRMRPDPRRPLPEVAYQFVVNRFTDEQEQNATNLALRLYLGGGWNPGRFTTLFDRVDALPTTASPFNATTRARVRIVNTEVDSSAQRPSVADPKTFADLKAGARRASSPGPSADATLYLRAFPNCLLTRDPPQTLSAQERLRPLPPAAPKLEPS